MPIFHVPLVRRTVLGVALLGASLTFGCGRPRPAESYKGPVRVRIENASLTPIARAVLAPVGTQETQPWLENIAPGKTAEALVRPDRYDLWFFASVPEGTSFIVAGGKIDVPMTAATTIVLEREGIRSLARRPPDVIVVTLRQLSKAGK